MLKKMIRETIYSTDETNKIIESIYLFGSFTKSDSANDIDILIIYKSFEDPDKLKRVFSIKKQIGNRIYTTFKTPIHYMTLSTEEWKYTCYLHVDLIKLY